MTRAVKAVIAAGLGVSGVEIDKSGKINVVIGKPLEPTDTGQGENEWDKI